LLYDKNKKHYRKRVHRLVAEVFCNKSDNDNIVILKDGDKLNCNANNLKWTTCQGRADHNIKNKNYKTKKVDQYSLKDEYIKTHNSVRDAAKSLNKPYMASHITKVCKGIRKTTGGYKWKYSE